MQELWRLWRRVATHGDDLGAARDDAASSGVRELRRKGSPTRPSCRTSSAAAFTAWQLRIGTVCVLGRAVRAVRSRLVVWWL